mgnify:CR=1 FL=1
MTTQTISTQPDTSSAATSNRLMRLGGAAGLLAAGTFAYGIAMFATSLGDYTDPDATPAELVDFLVDHQGQLLAWYIGIFLVFGAALVPLALALRERLVDRAPILTNTATVFAGVWVALMFATGMISNIGIEVVADLAETDPTQATSVWSSIDAVTDGLGGGNEIVGGLWIGLISAAGFVTGRLPRCGHHGARLRGGRDGVRARLDRLVRRRRCRTASPQRDRERGRAQLVSTRVNTPRAMITDWTLCTMIPSHALR